LRDALKITLIEKSEMSFREDKINILKMGTKAQSKSELY